MEKEIDSSLLDSKGVKLSSLIEYNEGSIVSKTLINKKSGTVTFFAFDTGEGLSGHKAPYDALVFIIEGEMFISIENDNCTVKSGNIILLPANKMHALKANAKTKMLLIMIKENA